MKKFISLFLIILELNSFNSMAQTPPPAYSSASHTNFVRTWHARKPEKNAGILMNAGVTDVFQSTQYTDGLGRPVQQVTKQGSIVGGTNTDLVQAYLYDQDGLQRRNYLPFAANTTGGNASINDGKFKLNPFQQQAAFYNSTNPQSPIYGQGETYFFSENVYEASPIATIEKTMSPGNNWVGSGKGAESKTWFNTASDSVIAWRVPNNLVTPGNFGSYYAEGHTGGQNNNYYWGLELIKTVLIDQHGKQTISFINKEGLTVLRKVQIIASTDDGGGKGHFGWLCTYYIYDDLNRLRCVIQPRGVEMLSGNNWQLTQEILNEQCFRYEYDGRNRIVMKKAPGSGEEYMIYDTRDRLVMMQDANLRITNQWATTLYDEFNRLVITGLITYNGSFAALQTAVTSKTTTPTNPGSGIPVDLILNEPNTSGAFMALRGIEMVNEFETAPSAEFSAEITEGPGGYDGETSVIEGQIIHKNPIPDGVSLEVLTCKYYDNYNFPSGPFINTDYDASFNNSLLASSNTVWPYPQANTMLNNPMGLLTGTRTKVLGTSTFLYAVLIYDNDGRVIQSKSTNPTGGTDITTKQYSWNGMSLVKIDKLEKSGNPYNTVEVTTYRHYDNLGRVIRISKKVSNNVNGTMVNKPEQDIVKYEYDALGRIKKKTLAPAYNNNNGLETLVYDYNILGWMLGINRSYLINQSTTGYADHYFGFELGYDKTVTTPGSGNFLVAQYNGNVAGAIWKSKGDQVRRKFDFEYDAANRLGKAAFIQNTNVSGTMWNNQEAQFDVFGPDADNNGKLKYDANGNLLGMVQKGIKLGTPAAVIDALHYNYFPNSNRLQQVTDDMNDENSQLGDFKYTASTKTGTDFSYDLSGNLTADKNKKISSITYNLLNLPAQIKVTGKGTINYTYDALGNKLNRLVIDSTVTPVKISRTDYFGLAIFQNDTLELIAHEAGRIRFEPAVGTQPAGLQYDYMLQDHLGNIRMVLTEEIQIDKYPVASLETSKISLEKNYYNITDAQVSDKASATGLPTYTNDNGIGNNPSDPAFESANSTKLFRLNSNEVKTGMGITLKVMSGDRIDIHGKSYYFQNNTGGSSANLAIPVLEILTGFLGGPTGTVVSDIHRGVTAAQLNGYSGTTSGISALLSNQTTNSNQAPTVPKAYINYLFFDDQFKCVGSGFSKVGSNSVIKNHFSELQNIVAPKNGYVYIYCSNESPVNVFFDNLQVVHSRGPILEETHYYPFGLTMAGISSKAAGTIENRFKFNSGTELNSSFDIYFYETAFRTYDPQIGRFLQIDPQGETTSNWSSFSFVQNNPLLFNDPLGLDTSDAPWMTPVVVTPRNNWQDYVWGDGGGYWYGGGAGSGYDPASDPFYTDWAKGQQNFGGFPATSYQSPLKPVPGPGKVIPIEVPSPRRLIIPVGAPLLTIVGVVLPLSTGPRYGKPTEKYFDMHPELRETTKPDPQILPYPKDGEQERPPLYLVRYGPNPESLEELTSDAENALQGGYPYGVSTWLRPNLNPSARLNHRAAILREVQAHFRVKQTGRDGHYTVIFNRPLTQADANQFNSLFIRR